MPALRPRFLYPNARPPNGYEYAVGGVVVRSNSRIEMEMMADALHRRLGIPYTGDVFDLVMEYMCPRLPDGYCNRNYGVKSASAAEVKAATAPLFNEPLAIPMLIDIFSERGYHCVVDKTIQQIPERVDLTTGAIKFRTNAVYRIQITFEASKIRRG